MRRRHDDENPKRGLWAAIAILNVILVLIVAYFLYWIAYSFFFSGENVQDRRKVAEEIQKNSAGYIKDIYDDIIRLTNEERDKAGLKPLKKHSKLTIVAQYKTLEMSRLAYFGHDSPEHGKIDSQFEAFAGIRLGIEALSIGENLALFEGYLPAAITAEQIVTAWMNSEEHRENILNRHFDAIGVSVYYAGGRKCYAAQAFMQEM